MLLVVTQGYAFSPTNATNAALKTEVPTSFGSIVINQNGSPPHETPPPNSAGTWVVPILQIVAWPALVAWGLWFFRKEIRGKVKNVVALKGGENMSVEFATEAREQQKASANVPAEKPVATNDEEFEKIKAEASTVALVPARAATILKNLQESHFTEKQQIELGALIVAGLQADVFFWRTYNFIFGSQIVLLQELNSRPLASGAIRAHFEGVKVKHPETFASWTWEGYLEFLKNFSLIQLADEQWIITELGRAFLVWLPKNQLSPNKPF